MTVGTIALTCLLLVPGQAPQNVVHSSQRSLRIPIMLQPNKLSEYRSLLLYVSEDQGRTWREDQVAATDKDAFVFQAPRDGEYWLRMTVTTREGKQEPSDPGMGAPDWKIVIDTLRPIMRITTAQRQGDEVLVAWEIQEDNPELRSLALEYRPAEAPLTAWTTAAIPSALVGQTRVRVSAPQPLLFRLQLKDLAGNHSTAQADVAGTGFSTVTAYPPPVGSIGAVPPPPVAPATPLPAPPAFPAVPAAAVAPPPAREPLAVPAPPPIAYTSPPVRPPSAPLEPSSSPIATTQMTVPAGPSFVPPRKPLPPLQMINQRVIALEYELTRVGPAGLESVDLYMTTDDGRSWSKIADVPELVESTRGGKFQRSLELEGEGQFGFFLAVKNKIGRGKQPPTAGDVPEIRIEVDITPPAARMWEPVPDPQRRDALVIQWQASDRNLAPNPITLEWSDKVDGPWHTIAANLPNTGKHSWQVPAGMPVRVFMRLRTRDTAGNEGIAVSNREVIVDLSEPDGRLLSVTPLQNPPQ